MCTTNLALDLGICNGSQGIIVGFGQSADKYGFAEVPIVQFTNGVKMKIPIQYRHSSDYPTVAIGQIPLCLAWALTIHKIQGATISMAQMDVGKTIFEYGQTYVALSRIKSLDGLYLSSFMPQKIRTHPEVTAFYETISKTAEEAMQQYIANNRYRGLPHTAPRSDSTTNLPTISTGVRVIRTDANGVSLPPISALSSNPFQKYSMKSASPPNKMTVVQKLRPTTTTDAETIWGAIAELSAPDIKPPTPPGRPKAV
jgi:hypothetical protein